MTSKETKEIIDTIISDSHLSVVIFYDNSWINKPIFFHLLTIGFPGRVGLIGKLCAMDVKMNWLLPLGDQSTLACPCCWSWCHDQTILWTGFKELLHVYFSKTWSNWHKKLGTNCRSRSMANAIPNAIADAITGTHYASWAWGWSFAAHVNTKGSCVNPSRQNPYTGDLEKCGFYVNDNHPHLVALGRVYEGLMIVHNVPLGNDQVNVSVEEVQDANACIPVPIQEV